MPVRAKNERLPYRRWLLVGLDAPPVRLLQAACIHPEERGEEAQLVAAQAQVLLENKPAHSLSAGRGGQRAQVGPVAAVGGQKAARADHLRNLFGRACGPGKMGP